MLQWRESTKYLQDFVLEHVNPRNADIAQEHIQCLIDCILRILRERNVLAHVLEATTIDVNVRRYDVKKLAIFASEESENITTAAKTLNEEIIADLRATAERLHVKVLECDKEAVKLSSETKVLRVRAEDAQQAWPLLCEMTEAVLKEKADLQIKVNETKCRTLKTKNHADSLDDEVEDLKDEVQQIWRKFLEDTSIIIKEADVWQEKINAQDARTSEAKRIWDDLEEDVKWSQYRNKKALDELIKQDRIYRDVKYQADALEKGLERKLAMQQQMKSKVEKLREEKVLAKEQYENRMTEILQLEERLRHELVLEQRQHDKLCVEQDGTKTKVQVKKEQEQMRNDHQREAHDALKQANRMRAIALGDLASTREEKTRLKQRLTAVTGNRHLMEKRIEKELLLLSDDLKYQTGLREESELLSNQAETKRQEWEYYINKFFSVSENEYELLRRCLKTCEEETLALNKGIETRKSEEQELQLCLVKDETHIAGVQQQLKEEVETLQTRVAEKEVLLEERLKNKEVVHPRYTDIRDQFDNALVTHKDKREEVVEKNRKVKSLQEAVESYQEQIIELAEYREDLKRKLKEVHAAMIEHMKKVRTGFNESGAGIYEILKVYEALETQNLDIQSQCKDMLHKSEVHGEDITSCRNVLRLRAVELEELRHELKLLSEEEERMTVFASARDSKNLDAITNIKICSSERGKHMESTRKRMNELLVNFATMVQPTSISKRRASRRINRATKVKKLENTSS